MRRHVLLLGLLLLIPQLCLADATRRVIRTPGKQPLAGPVQDTSGRESLLRWGRAINPKHPLRRQLGSEALLSATLDLVESNDLHRQPRHVRKALTKLAQAPQRLLLTKKTQLALLKTLKTKLGDERFTTLVGQRAAGIKLAAELLNAPAEQPDVKNMKRGWGWKLLPQDDKAFSDPTYLTNLLRESGQTGTGEFIHAEPSKALRVFKDAWRKIAPANTEPEMFTLTGSDANNLLYEVARTVVNRSGRGKDGAELLFFEDVYGGGRGKIADTSFMKRYDSPLKDYSIVSPSTVTFHPKDPAERKRLAQLERQALAQIADKVKHSARPIVGILIEPIVGANGVKVYRPAFMRKLRALCDELGVPIIADEILTGGGRTGKFFAYQHYKGFEPDLITFGKGLQVAGIASVRREGKRNLVPYINEMVTLKAYAEPLLKGAQVMDRIRRDNLMENARKVGEYLVGRLREKDVGTRNDHPIQRTRGIGLLIYSNQSPSGVSNAQRRLMPYLTLTKAEVDQIVGPRRELLKRSDERIAQVRTQHGRREDQGALPSNFVWLSELATAIEQAHQFVEARDASPRLKRQAEAIVSRGRTTATELATVNADRLLSVWSKNKTQPDYALSLACSLLADPNASLPAKTRGRLQTLSIKAVTALIKKNLAQARTYMYRIKRGNDRHVINALQSLTRLERSADWYLQSYPEWARALQTSEPKVWARLKRELDRLEPEVQAVLAEATGGAR